MSRPAWYIALHKQVYRERGEASLQQCAKADESCDGRMEWANISGEYRDVDDFMPLCRSHHLRMDVHQTTIVALTGGYSAWASSLTSDENIAYRAKRQVTRVKLLAACQTPGCTIRPYGGRSMCGSCREGRPVGYRNAR